MNAKRISVLAAIALAVSAEFSLAQNNSKLPYQTRGTRTDMTPSDSTPGQNGIRYGNWCGPGWSGGVDVSKNNGKSGTAGPVDSLDAACKKHDEVYDWKKPNQPRLNCAIEEVADKQLIRDLDALPKDPKKWSDPPSHQNEKSVEMYREAASGYFKTKQAVDGAEAEAQKKLREAASTLRKSRLTGSGITGSTTLDNNR